LLEVLIVNQSEVRRLLPVRECVDVMARAFAGLARGEATLPLRQILWLPERAGALGLMPAHLSGLGAVGLKAVTFFPRNEGTELDSHQGAVLLFETGRGRLLALVDATSLTAVRTAAVSGLATRLLARPDAGDLAMIGSGVEARTHLEAMLAVRPIRRVRVASLSLARARAYADREAARHGVPVEACASVEDAVRGADIVCTVTSAREPVLRAEWLSPGVHINAVGSSVAKARELDSETVARSCFFVDQVGAALAEAGDFLIPLENGEIDQSHLRGDLGQLVIGEIPGRTSPEDITVFKSVGLAIEDVASAHHIYTRARATGVGQWIGLGGGRDEEP
jgi:ornithine cyclodeaminase